MTHALILDMDGVLVDSGPFHFESWRLFAAEHGVEVDREFFLHTFGRTNRYIFPYLFGREVSEEELLRWTNRKEELFRELIAGRITPPAGLPALLDGLRSRGWKITIGSSAPRDNIEFVVRELHLADVVAAYTCSEEVSRGKPDPEVFLKTAAKVGAAPARCVVIEDAVYGIHAAHAAGMKCVAITTTFPAEQLGEADRVIESFCELSAAAVADLAAPRPGQ